MAKKFIDYDGPTGLFIATGEGIKPLAESSALVALIDSAMLSSLGFTEKAAAYEKLIADKPKPAIPV